MAAAAAKLGVAPPISIQNDFRCRGWVGVEVVGVGCGVGWDGRWLEQDLAPMTIAGQSRIVCSLSPPADVHTPLRRPSRLPHAHGTLPLQPAGPPVRGAPGGGVRPLQLQRRPAGTCVACLCVCAPLCLYLRFHSMHRAQRLGTALRLQLPVPPPPPLPALLCAALRAPRWRHADRQILWRREAQQQRPARQGVLGV